MEENRQVENDSLGNLPKINEDDNQIDNQTDNLTKNNINHLDTPGLDVKDGNAEKANAIDNISVNSDNRDDALIQNSSATNIPRAPNTYSNKIADESREEPGIGRDTVLKRYYALSQKSSKKDQKGVEGNLLSIIVIAYTILLLVLGFFVYRDIAKRLSNIENRVSAIEASIMKNQNITIENIKVYDAE